MALDGAHKIKQGFGKASLYLFILIAVIFPAVWWWSDPRLFVSDLHGFASGSCSLQAIPAVSHEKSLLLLAIIYVPALIMAACLCSGIKIMRCLDRHNLLERQVAQSFLLISRNIMALSLVIPVVKFFILYVIFHPVAHYEVNIYISDVMLFFIGWLVYISSSAIYAGVLAMEENKEFI